MFGNLKICKNIYIKRIWNFLSSLCSLFACSLVRSVSHQKIHSHPHNILVLFSLRSRFLHSSFDDFLKWIRQFLEEDLALDYFHPVHGYVVFDSLKRVFQVSIEVDYFSLLSLNAYFDMLLNSFLLIFALFSFRY